MKGRSKNFGSLDGGDFLQVSRFLACASGDLAAHHPINTRVRLLDLFSGVALYTILTPHPIIRSTLKSRWLSLVLVSSSWTQICHVLLLPPSSNDI